MKIQHRVIWRYVRGVLAIFLLLLSIFTLLGIGSANVVSQSNYSQTPGLMTVLDIPSEIHQQLTLRNHLHNISHPKLIISSILQSTRSIRTLIHMQSRFEEISSLTTMTLGPVAYKLYKLVHASQDWKVGGNKRELMKTTITNTPGITLRGITRAANIAMGSAQYWIRILEQENEIDSFSLGKSKHYFDLNQQWTREAKLLYSLIQNKRIFEILQCLNENPTITKQKDLCANLGIHKALVSYYVKILKNHNVIEYQMRDLSISTSYKDLLN